MDMQPLVKPEYLYCVRVNGVITQASMDGFSIRSHWIYQSSRNPGSHVVMEDLSGRVLEDNQLCKMCNQPLHQERTMSNKNVGKRYEITALGGLFVVFEKDNENDPGHILKETDGYTYHRSRSDAYLWILHNKLFGNKVAAQALIAGGDSGVEKRMDALVKYLSECGMSKEQVIYTLALMNEYDSAWKAIEDNEQ